MSLLLGFLLAMTVTMALIPPLMQVAERLRFLDVPDRRKVHTVAIPRVGGIAMAAGTLLALAASGLFGQPMPAYLAGVVVLLAFGVCDDRYTLSAPAKFAGQMIAVGIVMGFGHVEISTITLAERVVLPQWIELPLTFLFLLGVTNAVNLADGLDGLAGGTTLLALAALALLAFTSGNPFVGVVAIVISGAILGFLRFNTHPARVFMGDGGSQILGFSAGVLAAVLTQDRESPLSAGLPLLLLGIPIIDTLMVMTRRIMAGRSPFTADRNHFHHRLLAFGFDHHEAVIAIYCVQALLFVAAWQLRYESDLTILAAFAATVVLVMVPLELASRYGWRLRSATAVPGRPTSPLGRWVQRVRQPKRLPYWALMTSGATVAIYFIVVGATPTQVSLDVGIMAALLACWIITFLVLRWRATEAGWVDRGALFIAAVVAVYLERGSATALPLWHETQWVFFGALLLAVLVRLRLAGGGQFRMTPLDVLVVLVALVVPNLPGSITATAFLSVAVVKLIVILYGIETLCGAERWWRLPSVAACVFLVVCAARALAV